jgi:uncharacterized membrane protein YdbT with pleckstrin-like domain
MGYVDANLMKNEKVVYRARFHWIIFLRLKALLTLSIAALIERATSEFAVTNRRVIIKVGLVARRTVELNLSQVESVGVDQSIFGRLLGYGTIIVRGSGGTYESFKAIAKPLAFRKAVNEATEAAQNVSGAQRDKAQVA